MSLKLLQKVEWLDSDVETAVGLFLDRLDGGRGPGGGLLLESAAVDGRWGRYSLATGDFLLSAACRAGRLKLSLDDERLKPLAGLDGSPFWEGLSELTEALKIEPEKPGQPPIARALYGWLGPGAAAAAPASPGTEDEAVFVLPGTLYLFDHPYNQLVKLSLRPAPARRALEAPPPAPPGPTSSVWNRETYLRVASSLREELRLGRALEITLAARFSADFSGDLFPAYRRLRRASPSAYMVFLRQGDFSLAVSSPEAMVAGEAGKLLLNPLAGSGASARGPEEDNLFEDELISDPGEMSRHRNLVGQGLEELGRVAAPGSVKVERFMERFENSRRPSSRIEAIAAGHNGAEVLKALFPAGAVSGTPKAAALKALETLAPEELQLCLYGGAVGWLGLDEGAINMDFGLTSPGLWSRSGRAFWAAGTGLTADSDLESSWREIADRAEKVKALLSPPKSVSPPPVLKFTARTQAAAGAETAPRLPLMMENLAGRLNLSREEAALLFSRLLDGELSPAQAGALLMGLKAKGETPVELAEAARAVLERAVPLPPLPGPFIDIVGSGGDGRYSFNCSTAAALTMAGLGYKVVKHGNRSVSSKSGSADALELLGENLNRPPQDTPAALARRNFVFLFAPAYHPSFRHIMPVRKELGIRTLFNILGPLVNPARPAFSLLGVPNRELLPLMAEAQRLLGSSSFSAVVRGAGDYDEATALGPADVFLVEGDKITEMTIDPARYGFKPCDPRELAIGGPAEGVKVLRELLAGRGAAPMRDMLILNVALAIYVFRAAESFDSCLKEARRGVEDGAGGGVLA